jgi:hypothetical protein
MSGVYPKTAQTVMRHSTIALTMDTYGHIFPGQQAHAVVQMQSLVELIPGLQATGTDDSPVEDASQSTDTTQVENTTIAFTRPESAQRQAQRMRRETGPVDANSCNEQEHSSKIEGAPNSLQDASLGDVVREDAQESKSAPRRTRTFNPLIKSQMLCQLS